MRKTLTVVSAAVILAAAIGTWADASRQTNANAGNAASMDPFAMTTAAKDLPTLKIENLF